MFNLSGTATKHKAKLDFLKIYIWQRRDLRWTYSTTYNCSIWQQEDRCVLVTCLKLEPIPRLCCRVCANISYLRMSLSVTDRRANFIASSKWPRLISGTGS